MTCVPSDRRRTLKRLARTAFASVAVLALGACAASGGQRADLLQGKVRSARTRADHEELSAYYEGEAARLDAEASKHEEIARSYAGLSIGVNDGVWARHCMALAARLREAAQESLALAALHDRAAANAPR